MEGLGENRCLRRGMEMGGSEEVEDSFFFIDEWD